MNARKAKAIRRKIREMNPRGVGDTYISDGQRINPMRTAKKAARAAQ